MKTPAKGEFPHIDNALAALREDGWEISDYRGGLVIKGPGVSEIIYSTHIVTCETLEHILRRATQEPKT